MALCMSKRFFQSVYPKTKGIHPKFVLGTMTLGDQVNTFEAIKMIKCFQNHNHHQFMEIDTAHLYNQGQSEKMLGNMQNLISGARISTKVHPWTAIPPHTLTVGGLKPGRVYHQFNLSLDRLKATGVDTLYLHAPDPTVPIEETLEACFKFYRKGKFKYLGLSNYSAADIVDIWEVCIRKGWSMCPKYYQVMYNVLTRDVERIIPILRSLNMKICVFNPLAGGLLTGKHQNFDDCPKGRFDPNTVSYTMYRSRYWTPNYFNALELIRNVCAQYNLCMSEVALRWLMYHSKLNVDDSIILGASNLKQLRENLETTKEKLPNDVVMTLNRAWKLCKDDCPKYHA